MDVSAPAQPRDRRRPLRYAVRVPLLALHIVAAIPLALTVALLPSRPATAVREPFAHRLVRWWSTALLRIFGFRARRRGEALADPVLFVANHVSWLDITLLHSQRAACFVAKAEIAGWPLVGWLAARAGTIYHHRGSPHSLTAVMQTMVERLHARRSVAVFPEGGIDHTGSVLHVRTFHARILQAALDAETAVQPVALRYSRDGHAWQGVTFQPGESFLANFFRLLGEPSLDAEVHFLAPVAYGGDGRRRMAEAAREAIIAALRQAG
ncbi:MAG: lysophospholipid acyltransferase family protein [Mizugakiibacter sp.]|uniref:lysophospholipid acyltransferase family protein n=1 Tax=Mizugakiibacter sp. TaxID=1972610 RepID=UPI0031C6C1A0|nr:1-acyl-sn-glycerol-3-phosphate acyltransferase [Xanthomonadaceae bacterium]